MLNHVSLENINGFIPRIPEYTLKGENTVIKRICFSNTMEGAFSAIPNSYELLMGMFEIKSKVGIPCLLHLYLVNEECIDREYIIDNNELVERNLVPDAIYTGETWLLTKPKDFKHEIIEINNFSYEDIKLNNNKFIRLIKDIDYSNIDADDEKIIIYENFWNEFNKKLVCCRQKPLNSKDKRAFISQYWRRVES